MEPVGTSSGCCEAVWSRFHPVRFDLNQALMVSLECGIGIGLVGVQGTVQVDLRITTVFRREGTQWKIVQRRADPLVKVQDAASIVRK